MARRRADGGSFAFELEPDEDDGTDPVGADEPVGPHEPSRVVAWLRSWPRRRMIAVVATVALLAGVGVTASVLGDRARRQAWQRVAATAPGAVLDLGDEPTEAWRTELDQPAAVGVVGGRLVMTDGVSAGGSWTLHGVDLVTGDVAWSTSVPGMQTCDVAPPVSLFRWEARMPEGDAVVCLSQDLRQVVVVDAHGVVAGPRDLEDPAEPDGFVPSAAQGAGAHRVLVTPAADLVRIDRVGAPGAPVAVGPPAPLDDGSGARAAAVMERFEPRDVRVRLEDAATGEVRWEAVLDVPPIEPGTPLVDGAVCLGQVGGDEAVLGEDAAWMDTVRRDRLWITMCGLGAELDLASGQVLRQEVVIDEISLLSGALELADGGWIDLEYRARWTSLVSHVRRADGSLVGQVPAEVTVPFADDGTASALFFSVRDGAVDDGEGGIVAHDADDATERWARAGVGSRVLARAAALVVVTDGARVAGLDQATGAVRWEQTLPTGAGSDTGVLEHPAPYAVIDTWTDGRHVTVVHDDTRRGDGGTWSPQPTRWTTFDLGSGGMVWTAQVDGAQVFPIAGRLYRIEEDALVALT